MGWLVGGWVGRGGWVGHRCGWVLLVCIQYQPRGRGNGRNARKVKTSFSYIDMKEKQGLHLSQAFFLQGKRVVIYYLCK